MWPCVVGAIMSFCYSSIAFGRSVSEMADTGAVHGTVAGISGLSGSDKAFGIMNSLGAIL
jgi:hypothetical protein